MTLDQSRIDFFWKNGYLPLGKLLDDQRVELLKREYDHELDAAETSGNMRDLGEEHEGGVKTRVLQLMNMHERNIHFRRLLFEPAILDRVADLMGPNIMLFHDQALYKPPRHGGEVFWHQDNAYWKCRPATLISCWLTLDDVNRDNGAMQIMPGSHLSPTWHDPARRDGPLLKTEHGVDESKVVSVDLPAGGCMFHHCQTLHMTHPNTTERHRRALAIHFMPPGTIRMENERMPVSFARPMLRVSI